MRSSIFSLVGKTALVTGGSRGLGKAMARGFADAGADLFLCSRGANELRAAADEIAAATGQRVEWMTADMNDRADVARLAAEAQRRLGKVDVLVNNAGQNQPQAIDAIDDATWDRLVELNLTSCMALTRAIVPGMKQRGWGRVIHISSIMGLASTAGRNAYSATKSALIGLAQASANDLGPFGITVNCICPGPFLTELPASVLSPEQQELLGSRTALGRWGEPAELMGPALLLASEAGSYITGSALLVDGGVLARVF